MIWGQLVNIPVNNLLGAIYVIINAAMLIFGTIFGFSLEEL